MKRRRPRGLGKRRLSAHRPTAARPQPVRTAVVATSKPLAVPAGASFQLPSFSTSALSAAALLGVAHALGQAALISEMRLQWPDIGRSVPLVLAFSLAGLAVGLGAPRRWIRGQAARPPAAPLARAAAASADEPLARSICVMLVVALGMLWLGAICALQAYEGWRGLLMDYLLGLLSLRRTLLIAPLLAISAILGAVAGVTILALHAWSRSTGADEAAWRRLWAALLVGLAAGVGITHAVAPSTSGLLTPILCTAASVPLLIARPGLRVTGAARSVSLPVPMLDAGSVAACALLISIAHHQALVNLSPAVPLLAGVAGAALSLAWSPQLGAALAQIAQHRQSWLVLAATSLLALPPLLAALVLVGTGASAFYVIASRARHTAGGVQATLASVGPRVAAAAALVLLADAIAEPLAPLACAAACGVLLLGGVWPVSVPARLAVDRFAPVAALVAAILLVVVTPLAGQPAPAAPAPPSSRGQLLQELYQIGGLRSLEVRFTNFRTVEQALDLDWQAAPIDVVILGRRGQQAGALGALEQSLAARFIRRCEHALVRGGRVVIELPAGSRELASVVLRRFGATGSAARNAWLFEIRRSGAEPYQAVAVGRDVRAWLEGRALPEDVALLIEPLEATDVAAVGTTGLVAAGHSDPFRP